MLAHPENLSRRPSYLLARTSAATLYIYVAYVSLSFSVFIVAANLYQTQSAGVAYTRDELVRQEVFLVFVNDFVARFSLARKSRPQARLREQHQSLKSAEQPPPKK